MNVADYVLHYLEAYVKHIFVLPGGGSMFLNDAFNRSSITPVWMLHEQGAGFAACAYAQMNGLGVCMTTSGPGATNAITPCLAAWMDSIPVLFISGGVATDQGMKPGQRYNGTQEADIISIVEPITKTAATITSPQTIDFYLCKTIYDAKTPRKGPVWIEIPLDVQSTQVSNLLF
jgi:acetolactate synthase-1/2/3 large subunit